MGCPFCYIPFDEADTYSYETARKVIVRVSELGAKVITFGGGDPFLYRGFPELVETAKKLGLFVHVDTNINSMSKQKFESCKEFIDLIALPIDGSPNIHDNMRQSHGHFIKVIRALYMVCEYFTVHSKKIKINTVVSKKNAESMPFVYNLCVDMKIDIWSLYQYWRLNNSAHLIQGYDISDRLFDASLSFIPADSQVLIEKNKSASRAHTYFFCSHSGQAYTHDPENQDRYIMLGSIFDDRSIEKWQALGGQSVRDAARMRYNLGKTT